MHWQVLHIHFRSWGHQYEYLGLRSSHGYYLIMFSIAPIFGHDDQHSELSPSWQAESSQLAHKHGPSVTAPENIPAAKKSKAQGKVQRKLSVFMNVKTDAIVNTLQIILYIIKYILMHLLQINHNPEDSETESKKGRPRTTLLYNVKKSCKTISSGKMRYRCAMDGCQQSSSFTRGKRHMHLKSIKPSSILSVALGFHHSLLTAKNGRIS